MADTVWAIGFWPAGFWADGFWSNDGAPEPAQAGQTPAGRARRRKRYEVEIDGRVFEVDGPEHALALLDQAKELARQQAPLIAERIAEKRVRTNKPVHTPAPAITTSDVELREIVAQARKAIVDVYRMAAVEAEIRLRMEKQRRDDEDEDDILLLL